MSQVIAIVNQKGGVAKTTTTVNLAAALVQQGEKVLCVDLDPQANLTMSLGCQNPDELSYTIADVIDKAIAEQPMLRDIWSSGNWPVVLYARSHVG